MSTKQAIKEKITNEAGEGAALPRLNLITFEYTPERWPGLNRTHGITLRIVAAVFYYRALGKLEYGVKLAHVFLNDADIAILDQFSGCGEFMDDILSVAYEKAAYQFMQGWDKDNANGSLLAFNGLERSVKVKIKEVDTVVKVEYSILGYVIPGQKLPTCIVVLDNVTVDGSQVQDKPVGYTGCFYDDIRELIELGAEAEVEALCAIDKGFQSK